MGHPRSGRWNGLLLLATAWGASAAADAGGVDAGTGDGAGGDAQMEAMVGVPVERATLRTSALHLEMTPAFGGRVIGLRLHGEPDFLRVGTAVETQPRPEVSASSDDIAYLGHDVWVGPQSQWWLHQRLHAGRRDAAANWPPDPWLSLAPAQWLQRDARTLRLRGAASPLTGIQLEKQIRVDPQRADSVVLEVTGRNVRDVPIAWDIWFNTRVHADTRVFVPLGEPTDMRVEGAPDASMPDHHVEDGMLVLKADATSRGPRGKWFVQPAAGWMAGFRGNQALVIRFELQPREAIHPEQGQVELYLAAAQDPDSEGLLEMEVHAPYRSLAPGASMQAGERWTLLQWDGGDDAEQQRAFLCRHADSLGLQGACVNTSN